jgi:hypothetical protein
MIDNINQKTEHHQGESRSNLSIIFYEYIRLLYKDKFNDYVKTNNHRNQKEREIVAYIFI